MRSQARSWKVGVASIVLAGSAWAQVTQRASVSSRGDQGNGSSVQAAISSDGRYVAFASFATNLVPGDTGGGFEGCGVFVRDRRTGITERVSVDSAGTQGNDNSQEAAISADGRYVAFTSLATNLVPGDTNNWGDIFVRDRQSGTTERVSVSSAGVQGNSASGAPSISADGRYVVFMSYSDNLVPGDTNGIPDIFVHDRRNGTTESASVVSGGLQANPSEFEPQASISADGRYVAFSTFATNILLGVTSTRPNVFVRDRNSGTIDLVDSDLSGNRANGGSYTPSISADGRYVAFVGRANNLVPGDTNGCQDVFVRDRQSGATEVVSVDSLGTQANAVSYFPAISSNGRWVAFMSNATNLVPDDTNGLREVFVHDRQTGTTERVSVDSAGAQADGESDLPSISADGRYVAFPSHATNLVPGDTNDAFDVFVRDRFGGPTFTSFCSPGITGVIACPCSNPPAGSGQGCDNSSATGGATLAASGGTYLSSDSLEFHVSGATPNALSLLLQGTALIPSGVVYGQGVRCVGGAISRLKTKRASSGSLTVPDFTVGEPTVSSLSEAKGDLIQSGQSRYYLVFYRDPIVLGGCPASSTFNATQTGMVTWSP